MSDTVNRSKSCSLGIAGMHCTSCEILIEDKLKSLPGVASAKVDHKTGRAVVTYTDIEPDRDAIQAVVESAGYSLSPLPGKLPWFSKDRSLYKEIGATILILAALYLASESLGFLDLASGLETVAFSIPLAIVIGLVAGFSTCMALVGGLVMSISARYAESKPSATLVQKFIPHAYFNLGRVVGYALFGAILGLFGSIFRLSPATIGTMTIAVSLLMLLLGLQLTGLFPILESVKIVLPKSVSRFFGIASESKKYSVLGSMVLGAMTFFVPCGFTQAMQLAAVGSGRALSGALIMGFFAIGTSAGLLGIGGLTAILKGKTALRFFRGVGLVSIALALLNITAGFRLMGFSWPVLARTASDISNSAPVQGGVQKINMLVTGRGYSPNVFTIKNNIPVEWIINNKAPYSCASALIVPELGMQQELKAGTQVIKFTPSKTGRITFSCSMGMYAGHFDVIGTE